VLSPHRLALLESPVTPFSIAHEFSSQGRDIYLTDCEMTKPLCLGILVEHHSK